MPCVVEVDYLLPSHPLTPSPPPPHPLSYKRDCNRGSIESEWLDGRAVSRHAVLAIVLSVAYGTFQFQVLCENHGQRGEEGSEFGNTLLCIAVRGFPGYLCDVHACIHIYHHLTTCHCLEPSVYSLTVLLNR